MEMKITDELLASYAKGAVSDEERIAVRHYLAEHPSVMQEVLDMMDDAIIDTPGHADSEMPEYGLRKLTQEIEERSISALFAVAANNTVDTLCDIRCEGYTLRKIGFEVTDEQLVHEAREHGWLMEQGTRIINIGRLCELHGAQVKRQLESNLDDILTSLRNGSVVIVSVDEGELVGDVELEKLEDNLVGKFPDHVVIVSGYNESDNVITIIDPNTPQFSDDYPLERFMDAWDDSENYMLTVYK